MSIPSFTPKTRAHFIEWQVFPHKRKRLIFYSKRIQDRNHLQSVFLFWIFLFFFTQIGFISSFALRSFKRLPGLTVTLPSASQGESIAYKNKSINIWIDRLYNCVINDKHVKNRSYFTKLIKAVKTYPSGEVHLALN